jgi:two-component system NtrC family sensor kinase
MRGIHLIVLFLVQLLAGSIIYLLNPKRGANRWVAFDLFLCCLWDLSFIVRDTLIPFLREAGVDSPWLYQALFQSHKIMEFTGEILNPYAGLMFAVTYAGFGTARFHRVLSTTLLVPCIGMLAITPFQPDVLIDYLIMVWWVGVYYAAILALLLFAILRAEYGDDRRNRLLTFSIAIPLMLGDYLFNDLARALDSGSKLYYALTLLYTVQFIVFVTVAARYGIFGVRILFRRQRMNDTMRAVDSGAAMLNHAMKNRLVNIEFLTDHTEKILTSAVDKATGKSAQAQVQEDLALIRDETRQLYGILERIHDRIRVYEMDRKPLSVEELLRKLVEANRPLFEEKGIRVSFAADYLPELSADALHLRELFHNLIGNAVDAMTPDRGELTVRCRRERRFAVVTVEDNGCGIGKAELDRIFEPFYSTKKRSGNFGLGLSYCYMVAQQHGGAITAGARKGGGTAFTVRLPLPSAREALKQPQSQSQTHGWT